MPVLSIDWVMGLQVQLMVREWYIGTAGFLSSIDGLKKGTAEFPNSIDGWWEMLEMDFQVLLKI